MTESAWDTFFDLLRKVVSLTDEHDNGLPWKDKRNRTVQAAQDRDAVTDLEEFAGWFDE
jgi:hypothetical protein